MDFTGWSHLFQGYGLDQHCNVLLAQEPKIKAHCWPFQDEEKECGSEKNLSLPTG